jgi:CheY-like chemotaxis protein
MSTILIVEDDRDSREMLSTWLERHGFSAITAGDGREALDKLAQAPDDLSVILLDLMMPGMTGWQFRAAQRANPRFRRVPVVVMTGHSNPAGEAEWLDPEDVLRKPIDLHAVLSIVTRCCGLAAK